MHAGFGALRSHCPMNIEAALPEVGARLWAEHAEVRADVARIESMWAQALAAQRRAVPVRRLLGRRRLLRAGVHAHARPMRCRCCRRRGDYVERVAAAPACAAWIADALAEQDFLDFDEPYRSALSRR